jgi:Serine dehydrogenase proteinase
MKRMILPQLLEMQATRGNPVVFWSSSINEDAVCMLYECLRRIGPTRRLDLVLSTTGGVITVARRLALLLHEFTQHLTILVPYQARSAGTLLCLGANELVLGPMAELGPIDAHIRSADDSSHDMPGMISAEDIRAFRQMAEDWFGVKREKDRLQVLALIAQRVFPPSLSSFYRAEHLTSQAAHELLRYQLGDAQESIRQQIVNQLVSGYSAHNHIITRTDAQSLGLQVSFASPQEETLLWNLFKTSKQEFLNLPDQFGDDGPIGLIMSADFCALQMQRWVDTSIEKRQGREGGSQTQKMHHISWEIDEE